MAAIVNERTLRLQATVPRIIPVKIPIDDVEGLPEALEEVGNGAKRLVLRSNVATFFNSTPASATLTASREGGLTGTITWSVIAGSATLTGSGDGVRTVAASSIPVGGYAVIQAACGSYIATVILSRTSALAAQTTINLASQVTGQLANSNVSGLGALALLNTVNLNTQVTGALNGVTQVTNLGALAYAEGLAANQIGAGTLAAGVIYAGNINAAQVTAGTFTGRQFRTAASGERAQMDVDGTLAHRLRVFNSSGTEVVRLGVGDSSTTQNFVRAAAGGSTYALEVQNTGGGNALSARTTGSGAGVYGEVVGNGRAVNAYNNGSGTAVFALSNTGTGVDAEGGNYAVICRGFMNLVPVASLPSGKAAGTICMYAGNLYFFNGTNWIQFT